MNIYNLEDDNLHLNTELALGREFSNPSDSVCLICHLTFRVDDTVAWSLRLTSCPHVYHSTCLRRWFQTSRRYECVYCKGDFRGSSQRVLPRQVGTMNEDNDDDDDNNIIYDDGRPISAIMGIDRETGCFCIRHGHGLMLPSNISNKRVRKI